MFNSVINLRVPIRNIITSSKDSKLSKLRISTAEFTILANIANILNIFEKLTIKIQVSTLKIVYIVYTNLIFRPLLTLLSIILYLTI